MAVRAEANCYERTIASATNLTAVGGPYLYPSSAGIDHSGFLHSSFDVVTTFPTAGDTYTVTFEISKDGTNWVGITRAGYCVSSGTSGNATYVFQNGGAYMARTIDFDDLDARYVRVRVVVTDDGTPDNTLAVIVRESAMAT